MEPNIGCGDKGDKGDNDVYEVDDWINMIVNRDDMMRAYEWWRHVWYMGIRYEKAVLWADFYHEERWCIF